MVNVIDVLRTVLSVIQPLYANPAHLMPTFVKIDPNVCPSAIDHV